MRTKLVFAFISLSLIPALLLFVASVGIVTKSTKKWFRSQVETSLAGALEVAQTYYKEEAENIVRLSTRLSKDSKFIEKVLTSSPEASQDYLQKLIPLYHVSSIMIFERNKLMMVARGIDSTLPDEALIAPPKDVLKLGFKKKKSFSYGVSSSSGQIVYGISPLGTRGPAANYLLVVGYFLKGDLVKKIQEISKAYLEYKQLKVLKNPVKSIYLLSLLLVTLLVLFSATWFGLYFSKQITVPIQELAQATEEISKGNLDFQLKIKTRDEIAVLVEAFNRMTQEIKANKRRYMEVVLQNIATGVISLDQEERVSTLNKSAATLLGVQAEKIVGKRLDEILQEPHRRIALSLLKEVKENPIGRIERQIDVLIGNSLKTLRINLTVLKEENGKYLGVVGVFEDLTQELKAQRMIAWREVARRIAHEIKNPLTPIKLSAQRLRRRYSGRFMDEDPVFLECTNSIIQQADELKALVNEFSHFARMPEANPKPDDLNDIIQETLKIYPEAHPHITFDIQLAEDIPEMNLDRGQISRAITNLVNNGIAAMDGGGTLTVKTHFNRILKIVKLSVADTGHGIPDKDKARLFEPYFSTKRTGTGLGLTIVNTIVNDHNGYIRVRDNEPQGTIFEIEFPV
ncbi:MAG: HAMP domain-containing protein [Deltaproteobacteria bacterium]|nr:HAMP domain-containing protein [Deltaproteobacteria bacterium]